MQNGLQLNADKSEVLFLGTAAQLRSVAAVTTVDVAGSTLHVSSQLKTRTRRDRRLTPRPTVRHPRARACNNHIRALRHVRCLLTDDIAYRRLVVTKFDYCNALLRGAPEATLDKRQRVQNDLARIVCQRGGRADAGLLLRSLHWLPVRQQVTIMHIQDDTNSPQGASHSNADVPQRLLVHTRAPARALRSPDAPLMIVLQTNTDLARRAFNVAASSV